MRRATDPLRVALAILAGALTAPLFVATLSVTVAVVEGLSSGSGVSAGDAVSQILFIWFVGLLIGGPVALGIILFPLGPLWFVHHQAGAGPASFIGGAAAAGFVLGAAFAGFTVEAAHPDTIALVAIFTAAAALSGWIMWLVAYASGRPAAEPRQASTTPAQALP